MTASFSGDSYTGTGSDTGLQIERLGAPSPPIASVTLTNTSFDTFTKGIDDQGGTVTFNAGNSITNATTGLLVSVSFSGATPAISGNTINNLTFSNVTGNYITLSGGALSGTTIDATGATFGGLTGATATIAQNFAIEDKITHATDTAGLGFVRVKAGEVFVTPAPAPGSGSIQRGINVATVTATAPGDIVNIKTGTYTGNVSTAGKAVTLAPGSSPGQVTINGNLTLDGNDTLAMEVNGSTTPGTDFDQFVVNGTVALGGAVLTTSGTVTSNPGQSLSLIDNDDGTPIDPVTGTFSTLPGPVPLTEGSTVTINGVNFTISYAGGAGGNNVTLTQPPATLTVAAPSITETNADFTSTFTVTLDHAVQGGFDVAISSTDGTANGTDYALATPRCTSPARRASRRRVGDDQGRHGGRGQRDVHDRTGDGARAPRHAGGGHHPRSTATGTINNDDSATLTIAAPSITETNADFNLTFTVTLDHAVQGGFTWPSAPPTARPGGRDYALVTTTLHFAGTAGETHDCR